jgi:hypothetical protein
MVLVAAWGNRPTTPRPDVRQLIVEKSRNESMMPHKIIPQRQITHVERRKFSRMSTMKASFVGA